MCGFSGPGREEGEPHEGAPHQEALPEHMRGGEWRQTDPGCQGAGAAHRTDPRLLQGWVFSVSVFILRNRLVHSCGCSVNAHV